MTTTPDTETAERTDTDRWETIKTTWCGEGDPSDGALEEIKTQSANLSLLRALGSRTMLQYGELTADFVETVIGATVAKTMHDSIAGLDKDETLDEKTKVEIAAYLLTMVTLVVSAGDSATRAVSGKDPMSPDSFAMTIRDLLTKKREAQEATDAQDAQ